MEQEALADAGLTALDVGKGGDFSLALPMDGDWLLQGVHPAFGKSRLVRVRPGASGMAVAFDASGAAQLWPRGSLPGLAHWSGRMQAFLAHRDGGTIRQAASFHSPILAERLAVGHYNVFLLAGNGLFCGQTAFQVETGKTVDVDVVLGYTTRSRGTVVDASGAPLPEVLVTPQLTWWPGQVIWSTCRTLADGSFDLPVGQDSAALLRFSRQGYEALVVKCEGSEPTVCA